MVKINLRGALVLLGMLLMVIGSIIKFLDK
jgi:hypothetical protein